MAEVKKATIADLNKIVPLFNDYRKFYRKEASAEAQSFLSERLNNADSVILLAIHQNQVVGFVQLYFTFSSVNLCKVAILNDLYVNPEMRRNKIATTLIDATLDEAKKLGCKIVNLSTQISNTNAQDLYKKKGFKKDNDFFYFNFGF